jgi:uncharacterized protein
MTVENGPSQSSPSPGEVAAREPSMDDILASIRRIIADDDVLPLSRPRAAAPGSTPASPVRPAAPAPAAATTDAPPGSGPKLFRGGEAVSESTGGVATAPLFRPPSPRIVSVADKAPSLKLRDFAPAEAPAARPSLREAPKISASAAAAERAPAEAPANAPPEVEQRIEPAESAARELAPAIVEAPRLELAATKTPQPAASIDQHAEARFKAAPPPLQGPDAGDPTPAPISEAPPSARPATRRVAAPQFNSGADEPVLLSSASGARIGASFEALAESLMLRDPEMVERVTREMLRPMLKAWLDDNLPVVVERLVRAEIERIARGRG